MQVGFHAKTRDVPDISTDHWTISICAGAACLSSTKVVSGTLTWGSMRLRIMVTAEAASLQESVFVPKHGELMLPETSMASRNFLLVGLALEKLSSKLWSKAVRRGGGMVLFRYFWVRVAVASRTLRGCTLALERASLSVILHQGLIRSIDQNVTISFVPENVFTHPEMWRMSELWEEQQLNTDCSRE